MKLLCRYCRKEIKSKEELLIGMHSSLSGDTFTLSEKINYYHRDCYNEVKQNFNTKKIKLFSWDRFIIVSLGAINERIRFQLYSLIVLVILSVCLVLLKPNFLALLFLSPIILMFLIPTLYYPVISLYNIYKIKEFIKEQNESKKLKG